MKSRGVWGLALLLSLAIGWFGFLAYFGFQTLPSKSAPLPPPPPAQSVYHIRAYQYGVCVGVWDAIDEPSIDRVTGTTQVFHTLEGEEVTVSLDFALTTARRK
jgi:hypothetical protein